MAHGALLGLATWLPRVRRQRISGSLGGGWDP